MPTSADREKSVSAARAFLERVGFSRIQTAPDAPGRGRVEFVGWDAGGDRVAVLVHLSTQPNRSVRPTKRERAYLSSIRTIPLRLDIVSLRILAPDRALLRHHRDEARF
jgi:hypothetical protein